MARNMNRTWMRSYVPARKSHSSSKSSTSKVKFGGTLRFDERLHWKVSVSPCELTILAGQEINLEEFRTLASD